MLPMHGGVWPDRKRWRGGDPEQHMSTSPGKLTHGTLLSIMSLNREISVRRKQDYMQMRIPGEESRTQFGGRTRTRLCVGSIYMFME